MTIPPRPPPANVGALVWLKANLFSSALSSVLTVLSVIVFAVLVPSLLSVIDWALFSSVWSAASLKECYQIMDGARGACWAVITQHWDLLLFGKYPPELYWRPVLAFALMVVALAPIFLARLPRRMLWFSLMYPVVAYFLIWGVGDENSFSQSSHLRPVKSFDVGGFALTTTVAVAGAILAILFGISMELGRRSKLFVIRGIFVSLIEFCRGVPLIVLLFASFTVLNYVLPLGWRADIFFRVAFVVALASAALMSEAVRAGISKIPRGQYEAAAALGLSRIQTLRLVIIPQVFKFSMPRIARATVEIFKDTTLILVVGFHHPLSTAGAIRANADWNGVVWELYGPVAAFFFIICFALSRYAKYLERRIEAETGVP